MVPGELTSCVVEKNDNVAVVVAAVVGGGVTVDCDGEDVVMERDGDGDGDGECDRKAVVMTPGLVPVDNRVVCPVKLVGDVVD